MKACVNGKIVDENEPAISVLDYGILYGYGIFESMRVKNGQVLRFSKHLARLRYGADALGILTTYGEHGIKQMIESTVKENGLKDAYARLTLTRGYGEPSLAFTQDIESTLIIIVRELGDVTLTARLAVSKKYSVYSRDFRRNIKTTNFLVSVMAKAEADEMGVDDVILLNERGSIAECSTANIFIVSDTKLITPSLDSGILDGITRNVIIDIARRMGFTVEERDVKPDELIGAREVFKTSSIRGVVAVTELDGRPVGKGTVGPIASKLRDAYMQMND